MANTRGLSKAFTPTLEHCEIAAKWLNRGFNIEKCALHIINPETITKECPEGEPICAATFKRVFKKQIREAMINNLADASDCLAKAAKTEPEWAARYLNLKGKGYLKERIELEGDENAKTNQLLTAFAKGEINADEMLAAAQIVKQSYEIKLKKAHAALEAALGKEKADEIFGAQDDASASK